MVLTPAMTHALSLGKLYVYSHLHAPLNAEIELISSSPDEVNTLVARVAAPWSLAAVSAGSQPDIRVTVAKRSDKRYFLELRSEEPLSEPFLQFALEAKWDEGSLVYEYTALIDPPVLAETGKEEETKASAKAAELDAAPRQPVASPQHPNVAAPEPVPPPTSSVEIVQPSQVGAPVVVGSDKRDQPTSSAATNHTLASVVEAEVEVGPERAKPEPPTQARERGASSSQKPGPAVPRSQLPQSASPAAAQVTTSAIQPRVSHASARQRNALSAATEIIAKHPTWVLALVAGLVVVLTLLVAGLAVLIVRRQRRHATHDLGNSMAAPKVVTPANTYQDERPTEGDRRWQDRRSSRDRRKQSVPVAIERRTGLARRRSELIDDGHATVSMEVLDPIAEAEAYLAGGCYSHAEDALKEAITNNPSRLDLRIKLLEVYQHSGNETAFNVLADELRPALEEAGEECQRAVDAKSNGLACDETLSDDNSLLDDATASTAPASVTTQQKKIDSDPQQVVGAEASEHLIEWEFTELPTDVSNATPTPAQGEHQIDVLQQCGTAPTATLAEAFTDFLRARKTLKPRTIEGYKRAMATAFTDWHDKPLLEISTEMVAKRHRELSADHGAAYANRAMRFLRTLYNFALPRYRKGADSLVLENPVKCL
jgi:hypothetical protein